MQNRESTLKQAGAVVTVFGMSSLFLLAVSATITLDVLILMAIVSNKDRNRNSNSNSNGNAFVTGYLLGSMRNQNNHSRHSQSDLAINFDDLNLYKSAALISLATAPAIAVTSAVSKYYFHRDDVCNGFLIAWGVATGLVAVGLIMHCVGNQLEKRSQRETSIASSLYLATFPATNQTNTSVPIALPVADVENGPIFFRV